MKKNYFMPSSESITEEERQMIKDSAEKSRVAKQYPVANTEAIIFMDAPFEPFEDRVLVFPDPVEKKTESGIIIPDQVIARVKPLIGTVVRVGTGKRFQDGNYSAMPLSEGDRIYYGNYAGTEIDIKGIGYLIMRFADCFGRVK
jgi:chaperonin GroES